MSEIEFFESLKRLNSQKGVSGSQRQNCVFKDWLFFTEDYSLFQLPASAVFLKNHDLQTLSETSLNFTLNERCPVSKRSVHCRG